MSAPYSFSFTRPLLIYDDKCSVCKRFAITARMLSRGWIRLAGHYYSSEAINIKKSIFPNDYDSSQMFWLINSKGAYGARSGLQQALKEIVNGIIKARVIHYIESSEEHDLVEGNPSAYVYGCDKRDSKKNCMSAQQIVARIFNTFRHSDRFSL
jgi:hypothetical protein